MRIAMISTPFVPVPPPDYGGTELVVHQLVEGLLQRRHDVVLFATGDSRSPGPVQALYGEGQWPPEPLADLNHVSWALREVAQGDFDLVHAHSAPTLAVARLVPQLPLVYTLHHAMESRLSSYYRYFPEVSFVAISADQARREPGARPEAVIHHGLDPSSYRWATRPRDYVCFLGRFAPEKGLHIAIDAAGNGGNPLMVLDGAAAARITGPAAIDGIGPTHDWQSYWRKTDQARREASSWAAGRPGVDRLM
jgi:glycosyltransferase involved in cell wall biosynthesis